MRKSSVFYLLRKLFSGMLLVTVPFASISPALADQIEQEDGFEPKNEVIYEAPIWSPRPGDYFVADVKNDIGYFIHPDNASYSFPIITGRPSWVYYIGRYYFAATPARSWDVTAVEVKGDKITFGGSGKFMRLSDTPYGLHPYAYTKEALQKGTTKISFGCIILPDREMEMAEQIYWNNGGSLKVETFEGVES